MSITAIKVRKQFRGIVQAITEGPVVSEVGVLTPSGLVVTSVISTRSLKELQLAPGRAVVAPATLCGHQHGLPDPTPADHSRPARQRPRALAKLAAGTVPRRAARAAASATWARWVISMPSRASAPSRSPSAG